MWSFTQFVKNPSLVTEWRVMSYDLNFWRYRDEAKLRRPAEHLAAYQELCERGDQADVPDLDELPVDEIRDKVAAIFDPKRWEMIGAGFWESLDGSNAGIEVGVSTLAVRFDLRGGWTAEDANMLIDAMNEFGLPLFDPQVGDHGTRFT